MVSVMSATLNYSYLKVINLKNKSVLFIYSHAGITGKVARPASTS